GPLDPPGPGDARLLYAAGCARAYCQATDGLGWFAAEPDYRHRPGAGGGNRTGVYCDADAGGACKATGGGQAPGTSQGETCGAAQTRCAGGGHPRLPGQGDQQAGDCQTHRVRAVDALYVVGPAEPSPLPGHDTRPGPGGDAVRELWSGGEERRG